MRRYFLRRLLLAIPTLFGVTVLIFFVMRILPGDPLSVIVSEDAGTYVLTDVELAAVRADLGLDKALYLQYADWMIAIGKGLPLDCLNYKSAIERENSELNVEV